MRLSVSRPPRPEPPHHRVQVPHARLAVSPCRPASSPEQGSVSGVGPTRSTLPPRRPSRRLRRPQPVPGPPPRTRFRNGAPAGPPVSLMVKPLPPQPSPRQRKENQNQVVSDSSAAAAPGWAGRKWEPPLTHTAPGGPGGGCLHHRALPLGHRDPAPHGHPRPGLCPGGAVESQTQSLGGLRTRVHMCERVTSPGPGSLLPRLS